MHPECCARLPTTFFVQIVFVIPKSLFRLRSDPLLQAARALDLMLRDEAMRLALLNSSADLVDALGSAAANASTALSGESRLPSVLVLGLGSASLLEHAPPICHL